MHKQKSNLSWIALLRSGFINDTWSNGKTKKRSLKIIMVQRTRDNTETDGESLRCGDDRFCPEGRRNHRKQYLLSCRCGWFRTAQWCFEQLHIALSVVADVYGFISFACVMTLISLVEARKAQSFFPSLSSFLSSIWFFSKSLFRSESVTHTFHVMVRNYCKHETLLCPKHFYSLFFSFSCLTFSFIRKIHDIWTPNIRLNNIPKLKNSKTC